MPFLFDAEIPIVPTNSKVGSRTEMFFQTSNFMLRWSRAAEISLSQVGAFHAIKVKDSGNDVVLRIPLKKNYFANVVEGA